VAAFASKASFGALGMLAVAATLVPQGLLYYHTSVLRAQKRVLYSLIPAQLARPLLLMALVGTIAGLRGPSLRGAEVLFVDAVVFCVIALALSPATRDLRRPIVDPGSEALQREWRGTTKRVTYS